jgi:zinc D-Ala-D-Ala carboxypeptidase
MQPHTFSKQDIEIIERVIDKVSQERRLRSKELRIITRAGLSELLTDDENAIIDWVYSLQPEQFGLSTPRQDSRDSVTISDFILLEAQPYRIGDKEYLSYEQYIPTQAYYALMEMKTALKHAITDGDIIPQSSYRSPAYQAVTFLVELRLESYNLEKTTHRVAIPTFSEHGDYDHPAFDFSSKFSSDESDSFERFLHSKEYEWLLVHGASFGFTLSYPENNTAGIVFEPWHWRYSGPN